MCHGSFTRVSWLIHMRVTARPSAPIHSLHSDVTWPFTSVTWLVQMCDMTISHVCHDIFVWLIHPHLFTHSIQIPHDFFTFVSRFLHTTHPSAPACHQDPKRYRFTCATTFSHVCHVSFIRATRLIHMRNAELSPFSTSHMIESHHACHIWMSHIMYECESCRVSTRRTATVRCSLRQHRPTRRACAEPRWARQRCRWTKALCPEVIESNKIVDKEE